MARAKNRGLVYLRRSTDKQEISLPFQLEWAIATARHHGVTLDATVADLEHMQALGLRCYKDIRLDDGITGADLTRAGFLAVNQNALADPAISHLFIYKRDRFARPADAMVVVLIEKKLLEAGITVVFSDMVSLPFQAGQQDISRDISLLFGYYQGGEELRKHADRVLGFQRKLAEGGFRTGGNPPYGFVRMLVDGAGRILEKLPPGKIVQQAGCHVRAVPDDPVKIAVWVQMLAWKAQGWGIRRIAKQLNERGIPSPDAGRTRTDHGVKHRVSGKWSPNTVCELCRNPIILGVQRYGRRSEGSIRRIGEAGPRLLEEKDRTASGTPRIIFNDPALLIKKQVGEAKFEAEKWQAIQDQMDRRGQVQRGIPRVKDPARYPLACRLIDLTAGCGSILYARTNQGRAVYTCGRYLRTSGAECESNQVDAEAMLRFALMTLKQLIERNGNRDRLRQKLLERARRAAQPGQADPRAAELARLRNRQTDLVDQKGTIEYRMARERNDALYAALVRQYEAAQAELATVAQSICRLEAEQVCLRNQAPEQQAEAALSLLDDVTRITTNPQARAEVNPLLHRLGIWIGLNFGGVIKGKKRVVRRLLSGVMTFGNTPLPVPLHGKDNVEDGPGGCGCARGAPTKEAGSSKGNQRRQSPVDEILQTAASDVDRGTGRVEKQAAEEGIIPSSAADDRLSTQPALGQPEGQISITKVSRGDAT